MLIRSAQIDDLTHVYRLLDALRKESVWGTLPIEPIEPYVHSKLMLAIHDQNQRVLVAEAESNFPGLHGELVGVCRVMLMQHEYLAGLTYLAERDFYVVPRLRGVGIGKALWNEALQWGKAHGVYGACYGKITLQTGTKCVEQIIWRVFDKEPVHA